MQPLLRSAPAFELSVGGGRGWRAFVGLSYAAAAAALMMWLYDHALFTLQWSPAALFALGLVLIGLGLSALAGALGWHLVGQQAAGALRWDGQTWWLCEASAANRVSVAVAMDLDDIVLLRLREVGLPIRSRSLRLPRYVMLQRARNGWAWSLFRTALYASRRDAVTSGRVS